ncbi:MAG: hypothetical protein OZ948_15120 [Deltaproteobacteria bacterium]|nr:hypothetical protein [Deltaproteobacteria bacterium]
MTREQTPRVYRLRDNQPVVWFHRSLSKSNQFCLYCARPLGDGTITSDREHVIGRSFVPDGSFGDGKAFNFIFRACVKCNAEKANAERHVSSVTLWVSPARSDPSIDQIARRKASHDFHPVERGRLVSDVRSETSFSFGSNGLSGTVGLVGPPPLDPIAVKLLAYRQTQAFFSLVTSTDPLRAEGTRLLPTEHWWFGQYFLHADWGNTWLVELARRVRGWSRHVNIVSAEGYFRALLARDGAGSGEWFWALEWNKSLRTIGGIGGPEAQPRIFNDLPDLGWMVVEPGTRIRAERALAPGDDDLFADPEDETDISGG